MSNNIGRTEVAAAQNQKEVTINDADGRIDAAVTESLDSDYTSGNVALTDSEFQQNVRFNTTNLTVARTLTVAGFKKFFIVDNTDGTAILSVVRGSTSIDIPAARLATFYTDGTTNQLVQVADIGGGSPYDLGAFIPGTTTDAQLLLQFVFDRNVEFLDELAGSTGAVGTNPTSAASVSVRKNGSGIGTVNIATDGVVTFTTSGGGVETFTSGDTLTLVNQATADATLADISITLNGTRT